MVNIIDTPDMDGAQFKDQGADVSTPTSGFKRLYAKAAGMFVRNSAGTVAQLAELNGSGVLPHESGGLEADVSAYAGLVKILSGATSEIKCNFSASVAPTVNDDNTAGYVVGSLWFDTTGLAIYQAIAVGTGAANWLDLSSVSGGQNLFETIATDTGTSPVADGLTDTLTLTGGLGISTNGDSGTDTVTIAADAASTTTPGVSELATSAEVGAGTDTTRTITPDALTNGFVGSANITTLGTIATGTWQADTVAVDQGGTGQTSYTDGQVLIGNSTGNTLVKATLLGTADEIEITNGGGTIQIGIPVNPVFGGTEGIQIPSGTTAQRPGTPANGDLRWNSTTNEAEIYGNSTWNSLGGGASTNYSLVRYDGNGVPYTTTSNSFVDVDATNLIVSLTTTGGDVLLHFSCFAINQNATDGMNVTFYDVTNAVNLGGSNWGLAMVEDDTNNIYVELSGMTVVTGLTSGTHTFRLRYQRNGGGGSAEIHANNSSREGGVTLYAQELP